MTHSLAFLLALSLAASSAPTATSNPSNADDANAVQAQRYYDEGVELFRLARFEAAAISFENAYELVPESGLLYNISFAWEQAGQLDKALKYLEQYASESAPEDAEKVAPQIEGLRQRIARQEQDAAEPAVDADSNSEAANDSETSEFSSEPSTSSSDVLAPEPKPRVVTPLSGALLGVGVAGVGTGIGLAVAAWNQGQRVTDECEEANGGYICTPETSGAANRSRGLAIGADVAFAVGGASLVAATILLAVRSSKLRKERATAMVPSVFVDSRSVAVSLTRRF